MGVCTSGLAHNSFFKVGVSGEVLEILKRVAAKTSDAFFVPWHASIVGEAPLKRPCTVRFEALMRSTCTPLALKGGLTQSFARRV